MYMKIIEFHQKDEPGEGSFRFSLFVLWELPALRLRTIRAQKTQHVVECVWILGHFSYPTEPPSPWKRVPGGRYNPMDEIYFHAVSGVLFVKGPDGQSAQLPAWSVHAV